MRIDSVDFFYLKMPEVTTEGDGSQDALLVRVSAGGLIGWGECEASPLVSIASFVCPRSHGACRPLAESVLGETVDDIADIARISAQVHRNSFDLLQADHTLSGIEMALWDLTGKRLSEPVWRLIGYRQAFPKLPYASQLFGDTPEVTLERGRSARASGFRAAKFGWGPYGLGTPEADAEQVEAAREGLGPDGVLLIDAGTVWGEDVEAARARLPSLEAARVVWLEEPFVSNALDAYRQLSRSGSSVRVAGGEGCHEFLMARNMIDYAGLSFVQIDTGRIGGVGPAKAVADHAVKRNVTYVNHTFTTHLALSASLQPYAGLETHEICEYPAVPKPVARDIARTRLAPGSDGLIRLPETPGLGIALDFAVLKKYLVDAEIRVGGETLYRTPPVPAD